MHEAASIRTSRVSRRSFDLPQGFTALENVLDGMAFGRGLDEAHGWTLLKRIVLSGQAGYYARQISYGQPQRDYQAEIVEHPPPFAYILRLTAAIHLAGDLVNKRLPESESICDELGARRARACGRMKLPVPGVGPLDHVEYRGK